MLSPHRGSCQQVIQTIKEIYYPSLKSSVQIYFLYLASIFSYIICLLYAINAKYKTIDFSLYSK